MINNPINNPVQTIQGLAALQPTYFSMTSRYYGIDIGIFETNNGEPIPYVRRRFIPLPERFELLQEHSVKQSDRLDNITHQYLGDPEQFWRVCDANRAMNPVDLTAETGRRLQITSSEGISGNLNA